jgi:cytochrome b pre-mRNA-processing protein 3
VICEAHPRWTECKLQRSFQAWFQITNLYLYLLTVRLRSLDKPLGRRFLQELVNHFFIDAEYRMQKDYEIKQSRYIKNTLKTMLAQYHGSTLAYDEGLVGSDAMLAAALWRNLFGAGWGVGMAGVEGKRAPKVAKGSSEVDGPKFEVVEEEDGLPATTLDPATILEREAAFAVVLEKLVRYMRAEVHRLDNLPDQVIANGISTGDTSTVQFGKLSSPGPDAQVETTSTETSGSAPA